MSASDLPLTISWFDTAMPGGKEAIGTFQRTPWRDFIELLSKRRQGQKDGLCFAPATFETKPDGVHIGRKKGGALSRTAIVLDIEWNKKTGEIPPVPREALSRAKGLGLAALIYTSHNHDPDIDPRYRVVFPLSDEIACEIPGPEIMAADLGLSGVMDHSKIGPASLFYAPSCPLGALSLHYFETVEGEPVDADCITESGINLLRMRKAQEDRIAAEAQAEAAERRAAKLAAGFDPDDSLIEKIRVHLDLEQILTGHRYAKSGRKYRHPNSSSGQFGADIKTLGGVDRVFSHNATDPLHESNLPEWCGKVTALDAFDAVAILDFGGDRKKAMNELATRYGLNKAAERKTLARAIFEMVRMQQTQSQIENDSVSLGSNLGLSLNDVKDVMEWVRVQAIQRRKAA